jgi:hypothetical protein
VIDAPHLLSRELFFGIEDEMAKDVSHSSIFMGGGSANPV